MNGTSHRATEGRSSLTCVITFIWVLDFLLSFQLLWNCQHLPKKCSGCHNHFISQMSNASEHRELDNPNAFPSSLQKFNLYRFDLALNIPDIHKHRNTSVKFFFPSCQNKHISSQCVVCLQCLHFQVRLLNQFTCIRNWLKLQSKRKPILVLLGGKQMCSL